ncbi:MAG: twin-arginine translocation signal domain-containing protein [Cytophagales bacterium]|nr:MAG: twin-arginine translocation signal domain-containing protein [Cytophagales bacterium]
MNRRDFLKQTGALAAGALTLSQSAAFAHKNVSVFGLQLYSVRDVLPKDPKGVMTQLAQMGYRQFESYGGDQGFLWGMTPKEIKSFLNGINVKMVSTHFDYGGQQNKPDELKKSIDMAAEAGLSYLLCPYMGPQKTMDEWKRMADGFNRVGEIVNKNGLKFGYHNHDYSFKPLDGQIPQEYLLANTDPKNVMFELDLCWIEAAGQNAAEHLKKYGKRYELCHIKDYNKVDGKVIQNDIGKGVVNYKHIVHTAMQNGMKYFLVEQEQYPSSPMESMKMNAEYMKKLSV